MLSPSFLFPLSHPVLPRYFPLPRFLVKNTNLCQNHSGRAFFPPPLPPISPSPFFLPLSSLTPTVEFAVIALDRFFPLFFRRLLFLRPPLLYFPLVANCSLWDAFPHSAGVSFCPSFSFFLPPIIPVRKKSRRIVRPGRPPSPLFPSKFTLPFPLSPPLVLSACIVDSNSPLMNGEWIFSLFTFLKALCPCCCSPPPFLASPNG